MELCIYVTADGDAPFEKWLNALDDRSARARIRARLARVQAGKNDWKRRGSHDDALVAALTNREEAAAYIEASPDLEDPAPPLVALRQVAKAHAAWPRWHAAPSWTRKHCSAP